MKLIISDTEINHLVDRLFPDDIPVEDVKLRTTAESVIVQGRYPALGFSVGFEMFWELTAHDKQLHARLTDLRVAGWPAGKLRGLLLKLIHDAAGGTPGVIVEDDHVRLNLAEVLSSQGAPVRMTAAGVTCRDGGLEIELAVE